MKEHTERKVKTITAIALLSILIMMVIALSSCNTPVKNCTGIVVRELPSDTIYGRKGELAIHYNYVVREFNYPELQLVQRWKDIHNIGDTLIYHRLLTPKR